MSPQPTLFWDACTIIYWVEQREPWFSALNGQIAELRLQWPQARMAVSSLSLLACRVKPLREGDAVGLARFDWFFRQAGLHVQELNRAVIGTATELRAAHKLKTPDALQAASALHCGGSALCFLTNDARFAGVPTLNPVAL